MSGHAPSIEAVTALVVAITALLTAITALYHALVARDDNRKGQP